MLPSQRRGTRSTQGGLRSRFYVEYRQQAEEYDRDFVKKYDDYLNTTLIFVSLANRTDAHELTRTAGRSVLRHHPGPPAAPARVEGLPSNGSQNRQKNVVAWYSAHVVGTLPLVLRAALLLLSCDPALFLWDINITIAYTVRGGISSGLVSYPSTVAAGTASVSCPYQTPGDPALNGFLWRCLSSRPPALKRWVLMHCVRRPGRGRSSPFRKRLLSLAG